jgi:hypothetical protein
MWWDDYVPKMVVEDHLQEALRKSEIEIQDLRSQLKAIEASVGWQMVHRLKIWMDKVFPTQGIVNRLFRSTIRTYLYKGLVPLFGMILRLPLLKIRAWRNKEADPANGNVTPLAPKSAFGIAGRVPVLTPLSNYSFLTGEGVPSGKTRACIHLHVNALGNYFFYEMRDLLAAGLEELGFSVQLHDESEGFRGPDDWHIIVAPHEFFYLGEGIGWGERPLPAKLILINTEQPSTQWFQRGARFFPRAAAIWDVDYLSSQRLFHKGYPCRYLPLGYLPEFPPFQKVQQLPFHYGTCLLEPHIRSRTSLTEPLAARPLDIVFFGNPTVKRQQFYAAAAPVLAKYRCFIHFSDGSKPLLAGKTTYMDTPTVLGLVQRSRILLNIHRDQDLYFEWQRIVLQGIWQRTLVLSEPCSPAPPFRPGMDFVEADLKAFPEKLDYFLSTPEGQLEAQVIANEGFRTLTRGCRFPDVLEPLIHQLKIPLPEKIPVSETTPVIYEAVA